MSASVVVPCFNSDKTLEICMESLRKAKEKADFEIVVINDGSTDFTHEIAKGYADQIISHQQNKGLIAARATALKVVESDILIFVDSDISVGEDSILNMIAHFQADPEVAAVSGYLSPETPVKNFVSRYKNSYMNYSYTRASGEVDYLYGGFYGLRRAMAVPYETDFEFWNHEDIRYARKLIAEKKKIKIFDDLSVEHYHRYTLVGMLKGHFDASAGSAVSVVEYKLKLNKKNAGRLNTGNTSKKYLAAILLSSLVSFSLLRLKLQPTFFFGIFILWIAMNYEFLAYLRKKNGGLFCLKSVPLMLLDQNIRMAGVSWGVFFGILKNYGSDQRS